MRGKTSRNSPKVLILGPVLVALAVTGYKILAEEAEHAKSGPSQD